MGFTLPYFSSNLNLTQQGAIQMPRILNTMGTHKKIIMDATKENSFCIIKIMLGP